jgi:hypothetical protein
MGWDFCQDWKRPSDVVDSLVKSYTDGGNTVLAQGVTREKGESCAWFAVESPRFGRMAVVALIAKEKGCGYGYKEMSEDMGPYYFKVPANVWEAVKDSPAHGKSSEEWRAKVQPVNA